jgi:hypothetical protein
MPRNLGSLEHVFWLLNKSVGIQVVMAAEVAGQADERAWRNAFDALQRRHPMLGVRIAKTEANWPVFERCNQLPIPITFANKSAWTEAGPNAEWLDGRLAHELSEPFNDVQGPLMRATVAVDGSRHLVILSAHHSICDGISLSICYRDLLLAIDGVPLEAKPFPASLDMLCDMASEPSYPLPDPGTGIAYPRSAPVVRRLKLPVDISGRLVLRARAEGTTVHGALVSAVLHAFRQTGIRQDQPEIKVFSPVDVRARYGIDDDCGVFLGAMTAVLCPGDQQDFWSLARLAMQKFGVAAARDSLGATTLRQRSLLDTGLDATGAAKLRQTTLARDIMLTNIGRARFDATAGAFRLESLWGPLALSGYPGDYTVGVSTLNECIHVSVASRLPIDPILPAIGREVYAACRN